MSESNFLGIQSNETKIYKSFGMFESKSSTKNEIFSSIKITHPAIIAVSNVLMNEFDDENYEVKCWHLPVEHQQMRDTMIQCINHLILQRRPSATQAWINKLPMISKRIEKKLYHSANSTDEYSDPYTLVPRIQLLVKSLITSAIINPVQSHQIWNPEIQHQSQLEVKTNNSINDKINLDNTSNNYNNNITVDTQQQHILVNKVDRTCELPVKEVLQQVSDSKVIDKANIAANTRQVSSQGCSRVFIIKVLISLSDFVKGKCLPSIFTFKKELVNKWLVNAKQSCCNPTYMAEEAYYGGPIFDSSDPSTHWSEPHQLYTWWKNNVERKSKFLILQEDAMYKGLDPRRHQRARWCEAVVALSEVIRASSGSANTSRIIATAVGKYQNDCGEKCSINVGEYCDINNASSLTLGDLETKIKIFPEVATTTTTSTTTTVIEDNDQSSKVIERNPIISANDNNDNSDFLQQQVKDYHGAWSLNRSFGIDMGNGRKLSLWGGATDHYQNHHQQELTGQQCHHSNHLNPYLPKEHVNSQYYPSMENEKMKKQNLNGFTDKTNTTIDIRVNQILLNRNYANTFPLKLFDLMSCEDESIVGWQEHGTAFQVRNISKFVNVVLPKHFKHNNFTSFQRQLNLYGFRRFSSYEKGSYYHPQFQQDERALAESIRRVLNPISMISGSYLDSSTIEEAANSLMMLDPMINNDNNSSMLISTNKRPLEIENSKVLHSNVLQSDLVDKNMDYLNQHRTEYDLTASDFNPYNNTTNAATAVSSVMKDMLPPRGYNRNTNALVSNNSSLQQSETKNVENFAKSNKKNFPRVYKHTPRIYRGLSKRMESGDTRVPVSDESKFVNMDYMDLSKSYLGVNMKKSVSRQSRNEMLKYAQLPQLSEHEPAVFSESVKSSHQNTYSLLDDHGLYTEEGHDVESRRGRGRPRGSLGINVRVQQHQQQQQHKKLSREVVNTDHNHVLLSNSIYENYQMTDDPIIGEKAYKKKRIGKLSSTGTRNSTSEVSPHSEVRIVKKSHVEEDIVIGDLEGIENDLIDIRNPAPRRVYLDFVTLQELIENKSEVTLDDTTDYIYGFYHGILHLGMKDQQFHAKNHSSKLLDESLLKLNRSLTSLVNSPHNDTLMGLDLITHTNEMYAKSVRLGTDYQADIPSLLSAAVVNNTIAVNSQMKNNKRISRRSSLALENIAWCPDDFNEIKVDEFLSLLQSRKLLTPISIGMVLVVSLPIEPHKNAYRLCCILDIFPEETIHPKGNRLHSNSIGDAYTSSTMKVFDGFKEWIVPISACMRHMEGETEQALQLYRKHNGVVSTELIKEVDALVQTEASNVYKRIWSSEEVKQFFFSIKRFGDNVKKVWELHFINLKSLEDVQEFFLSIYPHTQFGGTKRVIKVYYRAELATAGYPDGIDAVGEDDDISVNDSSESSSSSMVSDNDYDELQHEEEIDSDNDGEDIIMEENVNTNIENDSESSRSSIEISPLDDKQLSKTSRLSRLKLTNTNVVNKNAIVATIITSEGLNINPGNVDIRDRYDSSYINEVTASEVTSGDITSKKVIQEYTRSNKRSRK